MAQREWWQKPRLRHDEEEDNDRRVGWLELFYDLVFVVVISELSHHLATNISLTGVLGFILLFLPVWWTWISGTIYNDRFETEGVDNRVFTFLQMLPVAAMAIFAHDALGNLANGFALSYAAARFFFIFLWQRAGRHEPSARPMTNRFIIGFGVSVLLFIISTFVPAPYKFVLWGTGLTADLITPWFTLKYQAKLPKLTTTHLPERFGLFVIIVLGEGVVGVVRGAAANAQLTWRVALTALLGMALSFAVWWIYFDFIARRAAKESIWWRAAWSYLHLPLVMGIVAVGGGILNLVGEEYAGNGERWLITGGAATALLATGFLEMTLEKTTDEPTHPFLSPLMKIALACAALGGAWLLSPSQPLWLLSLLLVLLSTQMFYGLYVWFSQELNPREVSRQKLEVE